MSTDSPDLRRIVLDLKGWLKKPSRSSEQDGKNRIRAEMAPAVQTATDMVLQRTTTAAFWLSTGQGEAAATRSAHAETCSIDGSRERDLSIYLEAEDLAQGSGDLAQAEDPGWLLDR